MVFGTDQVGDEWAEEAEQLREHTGRWFYECGYRLHRCLGQMYLSDERFGRNYDDLAPGLAG